MIAHLRRIRSNQAGVWALVDQGLVSLGGVATSVILARFLAPKDFGIYVLLFGAMLFLNTVHASIIVYPLSVRGSRLDRLALGSMTGTFLVLTIVSAVPLVAVLTVAAEVIGALRLAPWAAGALVCWQVQETIRRALFAELRHRAAVPGD